jgi:hypothetical protein
MRIGVRPAAVVPSGVFVACRAEEDESPQGEQGACDPLHA